MSQNQGKDADGKDDDAKISPIDFENTGVVSVPTDRIALCHAFQLGGSRSPAKCVTKILHFGLRYFPEPVFLNRIFFY